MDGSLEGTADLDLRLLPITMVDWRECDRVMRSLGLELPTEARARLIAQGDGGIRRAAAQLLIDNDRGLEALRMKVDDLIEEIERRRATE